MRNDFVFQLIIFLKGFGEDERRKLGTVTGICLANGMGNAVCLGCLFEDHLIKDGKIVISYLFQ